MSNLVGRQHEQQVGIFLSDMQDSRRLMTMGNAVC